MADDQQAKQHSELLGALQGIQGSLKALATIQLAAEFYTTDERRALRAEYDVLREKDSAAFAAMQQARDDVFDPDLSWDQRVQKYGERTARQHRADVEGCLELRAATMKDVTAFEQKHRLLIRLMDSAAELGKGKYE
ncbi:hypothetical protein MO767_30565 [Pseudomonas sp. UYIF39]|uniref:hypothetical protein n=1 Tax=Pseudomonas sp. UYIF39 TaxID=1630747 RepID=UPI00249EC98E|nr:hypothetical protein [Pseudomonas sp. UYIF39]MDI3358650.1 hypothetical protein [Pseudomonas sp. UYIF39]